jgi:hypothetical protein
MIMQLPTVMMPRPQTTSCRTLGQFYAFSVISGNPTGIPLPAMFFRRLLGQTVSLNDVQVFDEDWVRCAFGFMNIATQEELDAILVGDPLPGSGSDEPLTIENRDGMMQRAIDNIITNNSPAQFAAIADAFFDILPRALLGGLSGENLGAIIVGNLDVSAEDLRDHIVFDSRLPEDQRRWLLNIIGGLNDIQRRQFLRFVTGFSVLPANGWPAVGAMRVSSIPRMEGRRVVEPCSQTCFQSMHLSLYESEGEMQETLHTALELAIDAGMQERSMQPDCDLPR